MQLSLLTILAALVGSLWLTPAATNPPRAGIVDYGSFDARSGWLLTSDRLYLTRDATRWQDVTPPALPGERLLAADFLATGAGWALLARPSGEQLAFSLARTADGGATWSAAPLALFAPDDPDPTVARARLEFGSETGGALRVRHVSSSNFARWSEWRTADGGATWARTVSLTQGELPSEPARMLDGEAWRLSRSGACSGAGAARACRQTVSLETTSDGGQTWRALPLPAGVPAQREVAAPEAKPVAAASVGSRTMLAFGQGFDKCEIATLGQLADWRANSPYSSVNLYIGGSKRYCSNAALSPDYLRKIAAQGWTFIPTWVGPQSPCFGSGGGISRDTGVAQSQGWSEAQAAADTLARLGLTEPDGAGSVVYYDMEYYNTSDASCNAAVQAFVKGWVNGLHARGNLAGVYGTGSTLRLLPNLAPPPNAIWAAHWVEDEYNPEASVWNVYGLSNNLWVNHQRLRQYTGGHDETWGGATLRIDANALDGPVALSEGAVTQTPTPTPSPTPTETLTPTVTSTPAPFTPTVWQYLPMMLR